MNIRFESADDLPSGKILNIPVCIIAVGYVFQEDDNYYPQLNLHECLYEFVNELQRVYNSCTIYISLIFKYKC